jgi:hypothetical protein
VVCKQLEHVIVGYLRQVWDENDWFYEGQQGSRPGYSCESQVITVCQEIADSLDEGVGIDAIIIDFSKAFDSVPLGQLLTKLAASGLDSRVVVWVREFLVSRTQRYVLLCVCDCLVDRHTGQSPTQNNTYQMMY